MAVNRNKCNCLSNDRDINCILEVSKYTRVMSLFLSGFAASWFSMHNQETCVGTAKQEDFDNCYVF